MQPHNDGLRNHNTIFIGVGTYSAVLAAKNVGNVFGLAANAPSRTFTLKL